MLDYHDHHLQLNVVTHIYTGCWLIRHLFELKFDCNPWEIENRMRLCSYIKYIFGYNISKCTIQLSMCNGSTLTILFYVYLQEKHLSFHSITDAFTLAIRNTNKKVHVCIWNWYVNENGSRQDDHRRKEMTVKDAFYGMRYFWTTLGKIYFEVFDAIQNVSMKNDHIWVFPVPCFEMIQVWFR